MAEPCPCGGEKKKTLRVLELYSGIGGMHYALKESGISAEIVAALDINNVANSIYSHNFPQVRLLQRSLESLCMAELQRLDANMLLMSPPCQPFTRVGLQKDSGDERTKSLFHCLSMITQLAHKPEYLLLENVKGFDTSSTRDTLVETLTQAGYNIQEFLYTPLQFGIPNSRLRYFLLAKLQPLTFNFPVSSLIITDLPNCMEPFLTHKVKLGDLKTEVEQNDKQQSNKELGSLVMQHALVPPGCSNPTGIGKPLNHLGNSDDTREETDIQTDMAPYDKYSCICRPLYHYLENKGDDYFKAYLIPDKFISRFWVMDIVKPDSRNCCCFTKRYAHYIEGSGSVIQMDIHSTVDLKEFKTQRIYNESIYEAVKSLRLRFFTPREIANVMCFPQDFKFPDGLSTIQEYRVLGNSLNVHVVSILIRMLCWQDA